MRWVGATDRVRRYLRVAFIPQAGLAIGLMLLVTEDDTFADMRDFFLAVTLTVVLLNEIVGPIMTRFARVRSGDYRKDRARLIDFLYEENIVTDLTATSKEEAYERMVDVLLRTNQLKLSREEFAAAVFERQNHASTCLGHGLAIPHARLEEGIEIMGAMGISREGIDMDTPDGVPIHCIVMLATPSGARDRHLEVLSALALALAIGSDHTIQSSFITRPAPRTHTRSCTLTTSPRTSTTSWRANGAHGIAGPDIGRAALIMSGTRGVFDAVDLLGSLRAFDERCPGGGPDRRGRSSRCRA